MVRTRRVRAARDGRWRAAMRTMAQEVVEDALGQMLRTPRTPTRTRTRTLTLSRPILQLQTQTLYITPPRLQNRTCLPSRRALSLPDTRASTRTRLCTRALRLRTRMLRPLRDRNVASLTTNRRRRRTSVRVLMWDIRFRRWRLSLSWEDAVRTP
jgi:hypothetical protein